MSSITNIYPLDFTCYYDETSDEYNIPKDELIELLEVVEVLGNQNKKLKEENKKLTKERDDFEVQWHKSLEGQVELEDEIQELKEKYEGELITQEEFTKRSQLD